MNALFINGIKFNFKKIVQFDTENPNVKECFFFLNGKLVTSQFLNLFEIQQINQRLKN